MHSEKKFDWMKENYLLERLSLIKKNYLFEWIKICSNQTNFCYK